MPLKLVKYHPLFAYSIGDEFEVPEAETKTLIDGGFAIPVGVDKAAQEKAEADKAEADRLNKEQEESDAKAAQEKADAEEFARMEAEEAEKNKIADQPAPDVENASDKGAEAALNEAKGKVKPKK